MNPVLEFVQRYFYVLVPALLMVFYFYVTDTILQSNRALRAELQDQVQLLSWMQSSAPAAPLAGNAAGGKTLTVVEGLSQIEQLAGKHGGKQAIKSLRPVNQNTARLWLHGVEFSALVRMLDELLKNPAFSLNKFTLNTGNEPAKVNADLTIALR